MEKDVKLIKSVKNQRKFKFYIILIMLFNKCNDIYTLLYLVIVVDNTFLFMSFLKEGENALP